MSIGLVGFLRGRPLLMGHGEPRDPEWLRQRILPGVTREVVIYAASVLIAIGVWVILRHREIVGPMLSVFGIAMALVILYYAFAKCTRMERDRLLVCAVLLLFTLGFWSFYEQMGSSLNLFADRFVNRVVLGYAIPASTFQSLPSIFVIFIAPIFSGMWIALGRRGREPGTPVKFTLAIASCGLAFLVLALGARLAARAGKVPLAFLALNFLFLVTGELCLAPVAMSMVTRLAPQRIVGLMMGVFLLAYSASSFISALIAQLTSAQTIGGALVDPARALSTYASVYTRLGVIALTVSLVLLLLAPLLQKFTHDDSLVRESSGVNSA